MVVNLDLESFSDEILSPSLYSLLVLVMQLLTSECEGTPYVKMSLNLVPKASHSKKKVLMKYGTTNNGAMHIFF